jgi:ABC-2 type transport system permease protein
MIRGWASIYKRELTTYAQSTSTYIVLGLLFFAVGLFYHQIMVEFSNQSAMAQAGGPFGSTPDPPNISVAVIEATYRSISAMILFTIPILTMRLIAEERSSGTFELLVTCPVADWGILLGKYLALLTLGGLIVLLSSVYPLTTAYFGRGHGVALEWPIVIACYLQLFLIFGVYAAFGLMASSLTQSQIVASVITFVGLLIWNVIGGITFTNPLYHAIVQEFSPINHTENFIEGLLTAKDIVYYGLASFVCLFIAARMLESRRWRI